MNWFQRYGIPGAYFVGLMVSWVYSSCPHLLENQAFPSPQWLLALAAIAFLPIGYVISILAQLLYLNLPCLGVHRRAAKKAKVFPGFNYEPSLEAQTLLLSALTEGITVSTHQYIRNWIARRMDVSAISLSLITANFIAIVIACFTELEFHPPAIVFLSLVTLVMFCSIVVLRRQIIEVIAGVYQRYSSWTKLDI